MPDNSPALNQEIFMLPNDHQYFDGHFEHKKILPAVAQISLCLTHIGEKFAEKAFHFSNARFYKEIIPEKRFAMRCDAHRETKLTFEFFDEDELCSRIVFQLVNI